MGQTIERRRFGNTDLVVSALGFGGSEIGYQEVPARTVERLLNGALDAGLTVIDTAECYGESETLIGRALGARRGEVALFTKCGHVAGWGRADWRPAALLASIERASCASGPTASTSSSSTPARWTCSGAATRSWRWKKRARRGLTRYIGYSGDGAAARFAVECGRFDTLQTSVSVADQEAIELTLPLAGQRGMGVIAKRPLANAVWRHARRPEEAYYQPYWSRLRKLDYAFLGDGAREAAATALRFTLGVPGVHTAIVGTTRPDRWQENAALLAAGPLAGETYEAIRARWRQVAPASWTGQV